MLLYSLSGRSPLDHLENEVAAEILGDEEAIERRCKIAGCFVAKGRRLLCRADSQDRHHPSRYCRIDAANSPSGGRTARRQNRRAGGRGSCPRSPGPRRHSPSAGGFRRSGCRSRCAGRRGGRISPQPIGLAVSLDGQRRFRIAFYRPELLRAVPITTQNDGRECLASAKLSTRRGVQ